MKGLIAEAPLPSMDRVMAFRREASHFFLASGAILACWRIILSSHLEPAWATVLSALAVWHGASGIVLRVRPNRVIFRMGMIGLIVLVLSIASAASLRLLLPGDIAFIQVLVLLAALFLIRNWPSDEGERPSTLPPPPLPPAPPSTPDEPAPAPVPVVPVTPCDLVEHSRR